MSNCKDPLHIPSAKLVVYHPFTGEEVLILNKALLDQQNCWTNLENIKRLHEDRLRLEYLVEESSTPYIYNEDWTQTQFDLQDAWGFPRDEKYHRFWDRPLCKCPKMDNDDRWPTGNYIISDDCPLNGKGAQVSEKDTDK